MMGKEHRSGKRRKTGGFTFVEILAALIFLAVVIPVIVTALTLSNKASELTERGAVAGQLAENKLNEMLTNRAWQSGNATSGDCGADWPGYRWEMTQNTWSGGGTAGGSGASAAGSGASSGSTGTSSLGSSLSNSSTLGNTSVTELKVAVFFKVQGVERSVALTTLTNSLTSSTTTGTTGTGNTTP